MKLERFWSKVDIKEPDDCWEWTRHRNVKGYGRFHYMGNFMLAHRYSYSERVGDIPDGLFVLHKCDNPSCVNPKHLMTGTNQDNVDDKMRKGRYRMGPSPGSKNGMSKIKEKDVVTIRGLCANTKLKQREIGRLFGISQAAVSLIKLGSNWKNVK